MSFKEDLSKLIQVLLEIYLMIFSVTINILGQNEVGLVFGFIDSFMKVFLEAPLIFFYVLEVSYPFWFYGDELQPFYAKFEKYGSSR